jgi:integrase/recombinase XerC
MQVFMFDTFLNYLQFEKRYSKHTIVSYQTDLTQFTKYLAETYEITDLTTASHQMVRSWVVSLMDNGIEAKSINRKIACLKSYYKFLHKNGEILKNPMLKVIAPKIKKRLPVFVEEQQMNLLLDGFEFSDDFMGRRDRLILELLYGTGMRLSELIGLTHQSVDFQNSTIKVLGKGNKERIIPVGKKLVDFINNFISEKKSYFECNISEKLIVTDKGDACYPNFVHRTVKKYLSYITTLEKKSSHVLRHTYATHLLNNGADLNSIKELLGHTSLAATQVYTHNSIDKLKKIFEQAHPKA